MVHNLRTALYLRHHRAWNIKKLQQIIVPLQRVDVEKHGTRCVSDIGDMGCATGQTPDQPRVHITKAQLTHLSTLACTRYVVKDPLDLGTAEVSINDQSGLLTNFVDEALSLQLVAVLCGTAILPYDSMVDRLLGVDVPDDGGLTLIGNADGGDIASAITLASLDHISLASCSTHPGLGKYCVNSFCATEQICPLWSKTIALELVVPWSRARMYFFSLIVLLV